MNTVRNFNMLDQDFEFESAKANWEALAGRLTSLKDWAASQADHQGRLPLDIEKAIEELTDELGEMQIDTYLALMNWPALSVADAAAKAYFLAALLPQPPTEGHPSTRLAHSLCADLLRLAKRDKTPSAT